MKTKTTNPLDLQTLPESLPEIIPRHLIEKYLPGVISRKYLQNLDSAGKGPRRYRFGGKIVYFRHDLLNWVKSRLQLEP